MSHYLYEISYFLGGVMSTADITPDLVADSLRMMLEELLAPLWAAGHNTKSALARVARNLGLPYRRVVGIYYGQARRLEAHEFVRIQRLHAAAAELCAEQARIEARMAEIMRGAP